VRRRGIERLWRRRMTAPARRTWWWWAAASRRNHGQVPAHVGSGIEVTLIERNPNFISCPTSNLILGGTRTLAENTFGYDTCGQVRHQDPARRGAGSRRRQADRHTTSGVVHYDRLVLSPGIDSCTTACESA